MSDHLTPICDLIESLLSQGLSGDIAIQTARKVEAAMASGAKSRLSAEEQRKLWREKAATRRAGLKEKSPETSGDKKAEGISTNSQEVITKVSKKPSASPDVSETSETSLFPVDDWPEDYVDQFWFNFPPFRRQAKAKVAAKLARIRAQKGKEKVTWATLFGGAMRFAATNPGKYAPAPMVWLNEGRWDREYGNQQGGGNEAAQGAGGAKVGFAGIAARLRQSEADSHLPFDESPPYQE